LLNGYKSWHIIQNRFIFRPVNYGNFKQKILGVIMFKRRLFTLFLITIIWGNLFAQEKAKKPEYGWKNEMIGIFNFSQSSFDNWAKGGENSWAWQIDVSGKFINEQKNFHWANSAKLEYGKTKISGDDAKKAADEIKLESVYTHKFGIHINPYISVTGRTQMTPGYEYSDTSRTQISNVFDPVYFTQGLGVGWSNGKKFTTRFGAALKETITDSKIASERYNAGENTRIEVGTEWVTDYELVLLENIIYTTKLEMFSNLEALDKTDVIWDNLISAKVSKYISASFNLRIVYDKDFSATRQMKQVLAVGLSYSFL
jgi:hypothetical protein